MNPVPGQQPQRVSVKRSNVVATAAALPILAAVFFTIGWFVKPAETTKAPATTTEPTDKQDTETSAPDATDSAITTQATDSSVLPSTSSSTTATTTSVSGGPVVTLPTGSDGQELANTYPTCQNPNSLNCLLQQIRGLTNGAKAKLKGGFADLEFMGTVPTRDVEVYVLDCGEQAQGSGGTKLEDFSYSKTVVLSRDGASMPNGLGMNIEGKCTVGDAKPVLADLALNIVATTDDCAPAAPKSEVEQRTDPTLLSAVDVQFYPDKSGAILTRCGANAAPTDASTSTTAADAESTGANTNVPPTTQ